MAIEYIGEKNFRDEIDDSGQVWVARSEYQNVLVLDLDRKGLSLPVWSSSERVVHYLLNARPIGPTYLPHAISVKTFSDAWLSDKSKNILELLINPDGKTTRMLALWPEEFQESHAAVSHAL